MTVGIIAGVALDATVAKRHEFEHETFIFPETTDLTCNVVAGNPANTFSAWVEIADSGATTFSSKITALTHISQLKMETVSALAETYLIEVAYGIAKTIIARRRYTPDKEISLVSVELYPPMIPTGELVYIRMMCSKAGENANVVVRYHYH